MQNISSYGGASAALLIWIVFPLSAMGVVYKRRVEKGSEEKQNMHAALRKLSLVSAGHCPLIGFWLSIRNNVNLVWLYATGVEKRITANRNAVGLRYALGLWNSLQHWQFLPKKDPNHKLSDWHQCSGSVSLGSGSLGSFSSSRQPSWRTEHTALARCCPDQRSSHDMRTHSNCRRVCSRGQPAV